MMDEREVGRVFNHRSVQILGIRPLPMTHLRLLEHKWQPKRTDFQRKEVLVEVGGGISKGCGLRWLRKLTY